MNLNRIAPLWLQYFYCNKKSVRIDFVSNSIIAQIKKFQNRFWASPPLADNIALHSPFGRKKKIGNPINQISDRTLFFDFKNVWKILANRNAKARSAEASYGKNAENKIWLRLLDEIRTFFEENPDSDF